MKSTRFSFGSAAAVFSAFLLLTLSAVITSCKMEDNDTSTQKKAVELTSDSKLIGKWQDSYTAYNAYTDCDYYIEKNKIGTASYGAHEGTVYLIEISSSSGYIYYQFQSDITGSDDNYKAYPVQASGKWCATSYKNLTDDSVEFSDAYKASSKYDFPETLEECVTLYTIENGYFDRHAEYTKVN